MAGGVHGNRARRGRDNDTEERSLRAQRTGAVALLWASVRTCPALDPPAQPRALSRSRPNDAPRPADLSARARRTSRTPPAAGPAVPRERRAEWRA
jgi:hypothetical protein